ncbi:hypothetical protein WR25_17078 [Diploscapter pachys]|uniref:Uncharacterized protein n=1 Tax=Diploscapter pachys TaxID=2018661 RepID=A0A2A2M2X1_9BILA|nr:hypothetical protein WR25_17078 [Diploscapter pachys]
MCLPGPLSDIGIAHRRFVELIGQLRAGIGVQRDALTQQIQQVAKDLRVAGVRGLHAEQEPTVAFDLTKGAEHRITQLQLNAQALIDGALQQMGEQAAGGLQVRRQWTEQQHTVPSAPCCAASNPCANPCHRACCQSESSCGWSGVQAGSGCIAPISKVFGSALSNARIGIKGASAAVGACQCCLAGARSNASASCVALITARGCPARCNCQYSPQASKPRCNAACVARSRNGRRLCSRTVHRRWRRGDGTCQRRSRAANWRAGGRQWPIASAAGNALPIVGRASASSASSGGSCQSPAAMDGRSANSASKAASPWPDRPLNDRPALSRWASSSALPACSRRCCS